MDENSFTVKQICEIIRIGNSCGVSLLKLGNLHIEFDKNVKLFQKRILNSYLVDANNRPRSEAAISDKQHEIQTNEAVEQEELTLRERQISQAIIEDPGLAERLIMDEELEDDSDADDSDAG